jgi:quinol monooxygenase YgiN
VLIVSGKIFVRSGAREEFLRLSREAIILARAAAGCLDFVVAADPLEPDRVNVYEQWDSEASLLAFRGDSPGGSQFALITGAEVRRHVVASSGPA